MSVNYTKKIIRSITKSIPKQIENAASDLLSSSDFISRNIGMSNSYNDIMTIVQGLGREPVSLLGKDYLFIFDHVRRNYKQGTSVMSINYNSNGSTDDGNGYGCTKFTFYKEKPTVRFANVDSDPLNLKDRWFPDVKFETTIANKTLISYAESTDNNTENRQINDKNENNGVNYGWVRSFSNLSTCDMIRKTNDNFNHGKYETLIARFHTTKDTSRRKDDVTQTAVDGVYGMSHGRNLLAKNMDYSEGYDNPYCRVWTYHHQYNQIDRAIRPFCDIDSARELEDSMSCGDTGEEKFVSFRTSKNDNYNFKGGSERLDKYGVLNYKNGFVNIAPTAKIKDYFDKGDSDDNISDKIEIKKCMFSIENLAWKSDDIDHNEYDDYGLSAEQKGPMGGRIMWFPPYDINFNESVNVNWNQNDFIGRGEKIYTYTNTERTGTLSFTLLIDHPSILDYWEREGCKGGSNDSSNSSEETDMGDRGSEQKQEDDLLRFFAGCDILKAKPQKWFRKKRKIKEEKKEPPVEAAQKPTKKAIHCVVYYPNNYSGVDDAPMKSNRSVNAIHYLMNGLGAQKRINNTTKETEDIPTTIYVIPTVMKEGDETNTELYGYSGYEKQMYNHGISVTTEPLEAKYETIKKTYADLETNKKNGEYLTSGDGRRVIYYYHTKDYDANNPTYLAKYIGSEALSLAAAEKEKNLTKKPYDWYRRRWYYRVDSRYQNDKLSTKESYIDTGSFGLNSKAGYRHVLEYDSIASAFGIDSKDENVRLVSLADMFAALETNAEEQIYEKLISQRNVSMIKDIMTNKEKYKITAIKFQGHASYQGYEKKNKTLAANRALTLKLWMKECGFPNIDKATSEIKTQNTKDNIDQGHNNTIVTKMWRSASVIIEYDESEFIDANSDTSSTENFDKIDVPNGEVSNGLGLLEKSVKTDININDINKISTSPKGETYTETIQEKYYKDSIAAASNMGAEERMKRSLKEYQYKEDMRNFASKQNDALNERMSKMLENSNNNLDYDTGYIRRYDNEGEFFQLLGRKDAFMHNMIKDKIKYFDPAFHSISPEGFNARLNFLHQCTRQGSTVDASNGGSQSTAYNLAFGRPPVCILRLGDFYNTKIVITNLSIQYDNAQWDLNPEGIGVMPVFAKISLSFVFLGGSDLSGPISRLQNAVSFNYYANTGVYDDRAEMVEYESNGSGKEIKFKPFSYPDMLRNGGAAINQKKKLKPSVEYESFTISEVNDKTTDSKLIGKSNINNVIINQ